MKTCYRCKESKPYSDFYKAKERKDGHRPSCKKCCTVQHLESYHRNKNGGWSDKAIEDTRKNNIRKRYGITPEQYDQLASAQGDRCALCYTNNPGRNLKYWNVDHCHKSTVVRGLLCHQCNVGLGAFKDNIEVMERAIAYLRAHGKAKRN